MKNILTILLLSFALKSFSTNEIVVAKDGSGNFTTIQDALNSIPTTNADWVTIIIKNGVYNEHVMIKSSFVALVGESRSGTHIEYSIPRAEWYAANGSNVGTGVINIAANLHDIIIANMYIRNSFEGSEDYTEVIRSETGTTRLWFINLDVLCLWKDTFAPWGKAGGMYYVSECNFRGSIDAFCPRGYCYAINSRFTETKSSSPIWHEGVSTEDQKLVIQGGSVHSEYNKNVKLQNSQNYAKFYYLDVHLSDSITAQGVTASTNFFRVTGLTGLTWFADNISPASRKLIDAHWSFDKKWNPERTMPRVLPYASLPQPYDGRYSVSSGNTMLRWISARNATSNKVYFGTSDKPDFFAETTSDTIASPILEINKIYYWRVNTVTSSGEVEGNLWRFSTSDTINSPIVIDPPNPSDSTDYTSSRLNKFNTTLNCKTMPQEPAWISKTGSVSWTSGTGYKWGSSNAIITTKVNGCTKVDITFTNGSTSRPIIITDGGSNNDLTAYPTTANVEKTITFTTKTIADDDIVFKTSGSSGLSITKMIFYGMGSGIAEIDFKKEVAIYIHNGNLSFSHPVDIYSISGQLILKNKTQTTLNKGLYFIHYKNKISKFLVR